MMLPNIMYKFLNEFAGQEARPAEVPVNRIDHRVHLFLPPVEPDSEHPAVARGSPANCPAHARRGPSV